MTGPNWKTSACGAIFCACTYIMTVSDFGPEWKKWAGLGAAVSGGLMGITAADSRKPPK